MEMTNERALQIREAREKAARLRYEFGGGDPEARRVLNAALDDERCILAAITEAARLREDLKEAVDLIADSVRFLYAIGNATSLKECDPTALALLEKHRRIERVGDVFKWVSKGGGT